MKKILLMDTFSTIHVGNGALLENTIKICKTAFPSSTIDIMSLDVETNKAKYSNLHEIMFGKFCVDRGKFHKLLCILKQTMFMLLQIINEYTLKIPSEKLTFDDDQKNAILLIQESDICISLGGEMIGDTFYRTLPFWLFNFWLTIKKGKTFILFPQSVGPLKKKWTRALVHLALKDAALLVGRDKPSYETLLSLGFNQDKVMFMPDVAIQQEIGVADVNSYFSDQSKKVIGVTISKPPYREMGKEADFVLEVGLGLEMLDPAIYKILIMPSNYVRNGISSDYQLCLQLKERLAPKFETVILENRPYFPGEYTALLSQLEFFISTRMHVAILATTVATPTIAINTQHKIQGYMQNIGMEHFCVEYEGLDQIYKLAKEIEAERSIILDKLKQANAKQKSEHEHFIQKLREL